MISAKYGCVDVRMLFEDGRVDSCVDDSYCLRLGVRGHADVVRLLLEDGRPTSVDCLRDGIKYGSSTKNGHADI